MKLPVLISTIETFLDMHGIATKSGDFPKFIGEQNFWKYFVSTVSFVVMATDSIRRHVSSNFVFLVFFPKY